ncbi:unnamed protein product, partial [Menidia menidia]
MTIRNTCVVLHSALNKRCTHALRASGFTRRAGWPAHCCLTVRPAPVRAGEQRGGSRCPAPQICCQEGARLRLSWTTPHNGCQIPGRWDEFMGCRTSAGPPVAYLMALCRKQHVVAKDALEKTAQKYLVSSSQSSSSDVKPVPASGDTSVLSVSMEDARPAKCPRCDSKVQQDTHTSCEGAVGRLPPAAVDRVMRGPYAGSVFSQPIRVWQKCLPFDKPPLDNSRPCGKLRTENVSPHAAREGGAHQCSSGWVEKKHLGGIFEP